MLETKHLRDLNVDSNSEGPIITSTEFHPSSTVALVAGLGGAVSIVQVSIFYLIVNRLEAIEQSVFVVDSDKHTSNVPFLLVGRWKIKHKTSNCPV